VLFEGTHAVFLKINGISCKYIQETVCLILVHERVTLKRYVFERNGCLFLPWLPWWLTAKLLVRRSLASLSMMQGRKWEEQEKRAQVEIRTSLFAIVGKTDSDWGKLA